jgi:putative oxidoreductase
MMQKTMDCGLLSIRLGVGLLFLVAGFGKIMDVAGFAAMMGLPLIVGWLIALGELLGGLAVFIGFLTRWASSGLAIIIAGAIFLVHLPAFDFSQAMTVVTLFIHIALFATLIGLALAGSGKYAMRSD